MAEATTEVPAVEPTTKSQWKPKRRRKSATILPVTLMSKADAVRAALKAGAKKPAEGVSHVKEKFGIKISPQAFSAYKSQFAARKAAKKIQKVAGSGIVYNGRTAGGVTVGNGKVLDLLVEVRKLNDHYGAETVAKAVQALG